MNVFITGASGFIGGTALGAIRPLLGPGDTAFCLSRNPAPSGPGLVRLNGDLERPESFRRELLESDHVLHIAGEPSLSAGARNAAFNYRSTGALLSILRSSTRLKNFVYVSSIAASGRSGPITGPMRIGEDGPPSSEYGRSKRMAEEVVEDSGLPYTIFRPAFVYGAGMRPDSHINRFVSLVVRGSPLALFDFPGRLSLIHVSDLAAALAAQLRPGAAAGRKYYAQTEAMTAGEIFTLIRASVGVPPRAGIRLPCLNGLPPLLRSALPVGGLALLSDYFWAEDTAFLTDFIREPRRLRDAIRDVIDSNPDFLARRGRGIDAQGRT